jgi:hypothetical protein
VVIVSKTNPGVNNPLANLFTDPSAECPANAPPEVRLLFRIMKRLYAGKLPGDGSICLAEAEADGYRVESVFYKEELQKETLTLPEKPEKPVRFTAAKTVRVLRGIFAGGPNGQSRSRAARAGLPASSRQTSVRLRAGILACRRVRAVEPRRTCHLSREICSLASILGGSNMALSRPVRALPDQIETRRGVEVWQSTGEDARVAAAVPVRRPPIWRKETEIFFASRGEDFNLPPWQGNPNFLDLRERAAGRPRYVLERGARGVVGWGWVT